MPDLNDQTIASYRKHFNTYVERTEQTVSGDFQQWIDEFLDKLPPHGSIFEIGSASGRDARYITGKGFSVFCTDVIPQALEQLAKEGFDTAPYDFRDEPKNEWKAKFDGFFANAVLLHASQTEFEKAISYIIAVLKAGGICAFSVKSGQGKEISTAKLDAPRFFKYHSRKTLEDTLKKYPLSMITVSDTRPANGCMLFSPNLKPSRPPEKAMTPTSATPNSVYIPAVDNRSDQRHPGAAYPPRPSFYQPPFPHSRPALHIGPEQMPLRDRSPCRSCAHRGRHHTQERFLPKINRET